MYVFNLKSHMRLVAIVLDSPALEQMESLCEEPELKKGLVAFRSLKGQDSRGIREQGEAWGCKVQRV